MNKKTLKLIIYFLLIFTIALYIFNGIRYVKNNYFIKTYEVRFIEANNQHYEIAYFYKRLNKNMPEIITAIFEKRDKITKREQSNYLVESIKRID